MLNKVMIIGKLGRDPELRYTNTGTPVTTLSVATNESFLDRDGNRQERTEWHRVTVFQKQAENCAHYLGKGSLVYVEGTLQTRKWQDQQGMDRYTTEIRAQRVQFLDRKTDRRPQGGAWGQEGGQGGYGGQENFGGEFQAQDMGMGGEAPMAPQGQATPAAVSPAPEQRKTPSAATRNADLGAPAPSESGIDEVPF